MCSCLITDDNDLVDQQAIDQVYQQIRQTCKDIGFFYITGHGVEQSTMDLLLKYTQKFFALPMEKKTTLSIHNSPSYNGYIEPGITCGTSVSDLLGAKKDRETGFSAFHLRGKWGKSQFTGSVYRSVILCSRTAQKCLLRRLSPVPNISRKYVYANLISRWYVQFAMN